MKQINLIILSFLLINITSCTAKEINKIEDMFRTPKVLTHEVMENYEDEYYSKVSKLLNDENYLIAYDFNGNTFFSKTDLDDNNKMHHFGTMGQGPNEVMMMPQNLSLIGNKEVSFYSINKSLLYAINYAEGSDYNPMKIIDFDRKKNILGVLPVAYNQYIAMGAFDDGRYLMLDNNGDEISYSFDYPSFDGADQLTGLHKFLAFQGHMMRKPDGTSFCFAGHHSELLDIIKINKNGKLDKVFSFQGELAKFSTEGDGINGGSVPISKESKMFFIDTNCTDKYIYLLFSNKRVKDGIYEAYQSKQVLVFDWKGKPITSYELDIPVNCIAVDRKDKILYGYNQEDEKMVKFDLN